MKKHGDPGRETEQKVKPFSHFGSRFQLCVTIARNVLQTAAFHSILTCCLTMSFSFSRLFFSFPGNKHQTHRTASGERGENRLKKDIPLCRRDLEFYINFSAILSHLSRDSEKQRRDSNTSGSKQSFVHTHSKSSSFCQISDKSNFAPKKHFSSFFTVIFASSFFACPASQQQTIKGIIIGMTFNRGKATTRVRGEICVQ